jgi:hypothetical protein
MKLRIMQNKNVKQKKNTLLVETKGYGIIANSVMEDEKISLGAKGLYAYLISKSGANDSCFPSNKTIMKCLGIKSKITLNKYKYELDENDYLIIEERKYKSGRITSNHYYPAKMKIIKDDYAHDDLDE